MHDLRSYLSEAIGTFFLCFAGIGAILCTAPPIESGAGLLGIALAHGLALSVAVNVFGGISGAHFNPAVTCGMLLTKRISLKNAGVYVVFQLLGATLAALLLKSIFPAEAVAATELGIPLPSQEWVGTGAILAMEFVMTFLLMTAIFGTAVDPRGKGVKIGGFGIGLAVTFDILAGGPITGASMNPARSFGPALIQGHFDLHLLYWVAPIAGACTAALLYHHVLLEPIDSESD